MIIDVQELRERNEPLAVDCSLRPEEIGLKDVWYTLRRPVRCVGVVTPIATHDVRIQGDLSTQLDLVCGRCLKSFQRQIHKSFDLTYVPNEAMHFGEEVALSYGELDVGLFSSSRIDLNAVIIEQIVLEIPMKPLCSPECRGLCDRCGADLNLGSCDCGTQPGDPRWAALSQLRDRLTK
ncbi:MAG: DUF177 domain-containing protein [Acidobacteria bacterium]|nr:DUF177 domain-containing protein [Acidobacteriota bacterium]